MLWLRRIAIAVLGRYGASLRFPHLLLIAGALFGIDLFLPDAIPFLDEVLLGLTTLMFAAWKSRDSGGEGNAPADPSEPSSTSNPSNVRSADRT